jgi:hypothetical protein
MEKGEERKKRSVCIPFGREEKGRKRRPTREHVMKRNTA